MIDRSKGVEGQLLFRWISTNFFGPLWRHGCVFDRLINGFLLLTRFPSTSFLNKEGVLGGFFGAGPLGNGALKASSSTDSGRLCPIGLNEVRTNNFFFKMGLNSPSLIVTALKNNHYI